MKRPLYPWAHLSSPSPHSFASSSLPLRPLLLLCFCRREGGGRRRPRAWRRPRRRDRAAHGGAHDRAGRRARGTRASARSAQPGLRWTLAIGAVGGGVGRRRRRRRDGPAVRVRREGGPAAEETGGEARASGGADRRLVRREAQARRGRARGGAAMGGRHGAVEGEGPREGGRKGGPAATETGGEARASGGEGPPRGAGQRRRRQRRHHRARQLDSGPGFHMIRRRPSAPKSKRGREKAKIRHFGCSKSSPIEMLQQERVHGLILMGPAVGALMSSTLSSWPPSAAARGRAALARRALAARPTASCARLPRSLCN